VTAPRRLTNEGVAPPSSRRVIRLLGRLAARRFVNRMTGSWSRRKKAKPGQSAPRSATPKKSGAKGVLMIFVGAVFLLQAALISSRLLVRIADAVAESGDGLTARMTVRSSTLGQLKRAQEKIDAYAEGWRVVEEPHGGSRSSAPPDDVDAVREVQISKLRDELIFLGGEYSRNGRVFELNDRGLRRRERILELFRERGAVAFTAENSSAWVDGELWPTGSGEQRRFLAACGAFLVLLLVAILAASLGMANKDLGRVE